MYQVRRDDRFLFASSTTLPVGCIDPLRLLAILHNKIVFEEEGEVHQIYFEDQKSMDIKVKLALDNKLKGIGFWALGYDGEDTVLPVDD